VFVRAEKPTKGMIAYEKALDWRELFDLAVRENTPEDDLTEMGLRVAGGRGWMPNLNVGTHSNLNR
jgi:elongator complex protein 1